MKRWHVKVTSEYRIEAIIDGELHWFAGRHPSGVTTWSKNKDQAEVFASIREADRMARTLRAYVREDVK